MIFLTFDIFSKFFDLFPYICYIKFMIESLSSIQNFNKVNPFSKVDTANGMPINNYRVVDPVSNSLRSKEFISKENFKNLYTRTFSYSNGDSTEQFLKSKNLLAPVYIYNEAKPNTI